MFGTLAEKIESKYIPVMGSFELTFRCNVGCRFCYQFHDEADELTFPEIKEILDEIADLGCLFLSFTGGEPLMRKDFWEIAEYAQRKKFAVTLQTNGTLVTEKEAQRIKELNFFDVHISLLGAKAETHDWLTRAAGSFNKVMRAIEFLRKQKVRVMLKTTVVKQNFDELESIHRIARKFGCQQVTSPNLNAKNDGDQSPYAFRIDDGQMKDFYVSSFKKFPKQKKLYPSHAGEGMINCRAGRTGFCINPKGDVYPCVGLPVSAGNLKKVSFKQIWDQSEFIREIRETQSNNLPVCSTCELLPFCMRCKGMVYVEEGNLRAPSKEACRVAHIVREVMGNEKEKV